MDEALTTCLVNSNGGWKTFPFIIATVVAVGIASYGSMGNLAVYLIQQFNIPSVDAVQISNIVIGTALLAPLVGAVVSDACFGCFAIIVVACASCFLAMLLFTLTAAVSSLRPPPCSLGQCKSATEAQLSILFTAITLMVIGMGGTISVGGEMGVAQLDSSDDQAIFISWYFFACYISVVIGLTVIVYIQDNVGWAWGFALCSALSLYGLAIFLFGKRYYHHHHKRQTNPYMALRISDSEKRKVAETTLYCDKLRSGATDLQTSTTSTSDTDGAPKTTESVVNETIQIRLTRLLPLLLTCIVANTCISTQASTTLLQALVMERHIGSTFTISAASLPVFCYLAVAIFIPLLKHSIFPSCNHLTPLRRIGLGLFIVTLAMIYAGFVEHNRLKELSISSELMSVLWLVPCPLIVGLGQALLSPAQLEFFYGEFPTSLKGTATGLVPMIGGVGSYASTVVVELVRRVTGWLQDEPNRSRLDNMYWLLAVIGTINFACFLLFAKIYKK